MSEQLSVENTNVSYYYIEQMPKNPKFYSSLLKKIVTKRQIIKRVKIAYYRCHHGDMETLEHEFGELILIEKTRIMREGKVHSFDCEFAIGTSCTCWCGEKYHGWKGANT